MNLVSKRRIALILFLISPVLMFIGSDINENVSEDVGLLLIIAALITMTVSFILFGASRSSKESDSEEPA